MVIHIDQIQTEDIEVAIMGAVETIAVDSKVDSKVGADISDKK
jgi:hypothetical protein